MLYNNLEFGLFYLLIFIFYWMVRWKGVRAQNLLILASSFFFYAWWDWRFLSLILISSLSDFFVGNQIAASNNRQTQKKWLWLSIVINLGLLAFFKYYNFFIDSFVQLFLGLGYDIGGRTLNIILPVGISFYTFQTLSYSIDIYRGRTKASKDLIAFLAFVSFFPQLIAGPIERASNFLPQFSKKRQFDFKKAKDGLRQILWGLFKKVVLADTIGAAVDNIVGYHDYYSASVLLLGVFFFAFQLYGDFSGYSDIAIGTAKLLGFELMRNFNYPFFARDMLDFWRRWHISLTSWFKDYVFLSLNQGKQPPAKWRVIWNYILTFTLSGLWHGANWTFVIWGFLHGLYQVPYLLWPKLRTNIRQTRPPFSLWGTIKAGFQMGITWALNLFALVFFFARDLNHALSYLASMWHPSLFSLPNLYRRHAYALVLFLGVEWMAMHFRKVYPLENPRFHQALRWTLYYGLAIWVLYLNYDRRAFVYFQF